MRGVNKLIVEIKDTENEYFDRAILFLKAGKAGTDQASLNRSARLLLSEVKNGERRRVRKGVIAGVIIGVLVIGAVLAVIFLA